MPRPWSRRDCNDSNSTLGERIDSLAGHLSDFRTKFETFHPERTHAGQGHASQPVSTYPSDLDEEVKPVSDEVPDDGTPSEPAEAQSSPGGADGADGADEAGDEAAPVLALEHVSKSFGAVRAVIDGVIELRGGEAHALLGENGAGKSTMVKAGDVLGANAVLMDAYNTDVRPLLARVREELGLDPDPYRAYLATGHQERIIATRVGGRPASW